MTATTTTTTPATGNISQRTRAAGIQMATLIATAIATAARAEALGPDRAEKVREILRQRVEEERARAIALLEDQIREAGLVH